MHHGVKGQQWGVRRFRNYDGSLTSAGKTRIATQQGSKKQNGAVKFAKHLGKTMATSAAKEVGKTAAKVALVGGTAYALHKTGMDKKLLNQGKTIVLKRAKEGANNAKNYIAKNLSNRYTKILKRNDSNQSKELSSSVKAVKNSKSNTGIKAIKNSKLLAPSSATESIAIANRIAGQRRKQNLSRLQNGSSTRDKIFEEARAYAKLQKSKAGKKAKSSVRNRVMSGIDENDPRTWINAYRNAKDTVETVKRYGRAAKAIKNKDAVTAVSSLTPEITENTNKLIDKGRKAYAKVKRKK